MKIYGPPRRAADRTAMAKPRVLRGRFYSTAAASLPPQSRLNPGVAEALKLVAPRAIYSYNVISNSPPSPPMVLQMSEKRGRLVSVSDHFLQSVTVPSAVESSRGRR